MNDASKRFSTLQALAAIRLVELHQIDSDAGLPTYVATKWALTRQFTNLDDVEQWLSDLTGTPTLTKEHADA
jgi:aminoglycoside phosphotransferase (APT) family kinase protein